MDFPLALSCVFAFAPAVAAPPIQVAQSQVESDRVRPGGAPEPVEFDPSGVAIIEFEGFGPGRVLDGREYGQLFEMVARGGNAGLAIFDSDSDGDAWSSDLSVGEGNLLILQNDQRPAQTLMGVFDVPEVDPDGGVVIFRFTGPTEPLSVELAGLGDPTSLTIVALEDAAGASRTFFVPGGFTGTPTQVGAPATRGLDLTDLFPQAGVAATATAVEDAGFDAAAVRRLRVSSTESFALDRLELARGAGDPCTYPQFSFGALGAEDVETADLDGDGVEDLVLVRQTFPAPDPDEVVVVLNPLDPVNRTETAYPSGALPTDVEVADFTGDGVPDILVANESFSGFSLQGGISLLVNQGDGSFAPRIETFLGINVASIVARDFDGDGDLDVGVAAFWFSAIPPPDFAYLFTLINDGSGAFGPPFVALTAAGFGGSVLSADFDGDGAADAARANQATDVFQVLRNKGWGALEPQVDYPTAGEARNSALVDVDNDGFMDLLAAHDTLEVHRNLGDGTFALPVVEATIRRGLSIGTADWNSDGLTDVVVGKGRGMVLFRNDGAGGFELQGRYTRPVEPSGFALADMDGDQDVDFVLLRGTPSSISAEIWVNRGGGVLRDRIAYPGPGDGADLTVVEVDGDGIRDVVVADTSDDQVRVYRGTGSGELLPPSRYPVGDFPEALVVRDFDADGTPDLALACLGAGDLSVLLNVGDGSYLPQATYPTTQPPTIASGFGRLCGGDWNGDGAVDLAAGKTTNGASNGFNLSLLENAGDGTFGAAVPIQSGFVQDLAGADLNLDGDLDLVVVRGTTGFSPSMMRVSILHGDGFGSFVVGDEVELATDALEVRVGDWDLDGVDDLVVRRDRSPFSFVTSEAFSVLLNQGDASFVIGPEFGTDPTATFEVADLDSDGDLDVLQASDSRANAVSVFDGQGGAAPVLLTGFATGTLPFSIGVGDLNNDGREDVVVPCLFELSILLRRCD